MRLHRADGVSGSATPRQMTARAGTHEHLETMLTHAPIALFSVDEEGLVDMAEGRCLGALRVHLVTPELGPSPPVLVDPTQLDSALLNVLGNAISAVSAGGSVTIEASPLVKKGIDGVEIHVRDTGCGIPRSDIGRIFDPFFTTKPAGQGTGLGLSLTRRFFDEHHGEIRVESEVGVGTTVFMWLPAATAERRREVER